MIATLYNVHIQERSTVISDTELLLNENILEVVIVFSIECCQGCRR